MDFFFRLKLEFLRQIPASNEWQIFNLFWIKSFYHVYGFCDEELILSVFFFGLKLELLTQINQEYFICFDTSHF